MAFDTAHFVDEEGPAMDQRHFRLSVNFYKEGCCCHAVHCARSGEVLVVNHINENDESTAGFRQLFGDTLDVYKLVEIGAAHGVTVTAFKAWGTQIYSMKICDPDCMEA